MALGVRVVAPLLCPKLATECSSSRASTRCPRSCRIRTSASAFTSVQGSVSLPCSENGGCATPGSDVVGLPWSRAEPSVCLLGRMFGLREKDTQFAADKPKPTADHPISQVQDERRVRNAFTALAFKVKNTFIDDLVQEDGPDGLASRGPRSRSCPPRLPADDVARELGEGHEAEPCFERRASRKISADFVPLDIGQPQMSLGSLGHGSGQCRPCGWFWLAVGCTKDVECQHCHLCPASLVKALKKKAYRARKAAALRALCQRALSGEEV